LAVTVSEMAFASYKGVRINIDAVKTKGNLTVAEILFSESNGRFVVEVKPENEVKFKEEFEGCVFAEVGCVIEDKNVIFESVNNKVKLQEKTKNLLSVWRNTINW
jgi:phosphoribosylformylglycinamidine synthase